MEAEDIIIPYKGSNYKYVNGKLFSNGSEFTGKQKGFLKKTVNALNKISTTVEGRVLINELQSSSNVFLITKGSSGFKGADHKKAYANQFKTDPSGKKIYDALLKAGYDFSGGSGGTVSWDPSGSALPTTKGILKNATTDLGHELFHALDANRGLLDSRLYKGVKRSEWQAVYRENILRGELKMPLRTHYIKSVDPSGNILGGAGPRMLTPSNSPIKPSWYK